MSVINNHIIINYHILADQAKVEEQQPTIDRASSVHEKVHSLRDLLRQLQVRSLVKASRAAGGGGWFDVRFNLCEPKSSNEKPE